MLRETIPGLATWARRRRGAPARNGSLYGLYRTDRDTKRLSFLIHDLPKFRVVSYKDGPEPRLACQSATNGSRFRESRVPAKVSLGRVIGDFFQCTILFDNSRE